MEHTDTSGTEDETSSTITDASSFSFDPENLPNRMDVPLFMLVHQENTPLRANPRGYKIFDFMTSVIKRGLLESTTVLVRSRESHNLFRVHKQLFEATFVHFPFIYDHVQDINEEVYTFYIGSDYTVARFVNWLYDYHYPERIDLDGLTRIKMPTSRFASLEEYLQQTPRPCVSSPTSTINMAVDRGLVPYVQGEPIVYTQAQKDAITDGFPFLVHLRIYVFATQHGLNLLQVEAFRMARVCLEDPLKMRMRPDRRDLICLIKVNLDFSPPSCAILDLSAGIIHSNSIRVLCLPKTTMSLNTSSTTNLGDMNKDLNCDQTTPHLHSLLCFPLSIRNKIYQYLESNSRDCGHLSTQPWEDVYPHNLLHTCHQIHDELIPIVYSRRKFVVSYLDNDSLASLQNLSAFGLQHMRDLTIILYREHCRHQAHQIHNTWDPWSEYDYLELTTAGNYSRELFLTGSEKSGEKMLEEWKEAAKKLATCITAGSLHLRFICHVGDLSTGEAVVAPLAELPVLRECSISLGKIHITGLPELANTTRMQAMGMISKDVKNVIKSFRYQDLPPELRLIVLENTDLVPPVFGEIGWNPLIGYYNRNSRECFNHADTNFPSIREICHCSSNHASATRYQCWCWKIPKAFFQVSRAFREDSLKVFFENRIIVNSHDVPTLPKPSMRFIASNPLSTFLLGAVPSDGLKYVHSLEVIMESTMAEYFASRGHLYQDLVRVLEKKNQVWNPTGLRLSFYLPMIERSIMDDADPRSSSPDQPANTELMYSSFCKFFAALSKTPKLTRLFVYVIKPHRDWRRPPFSDALMFTTHGGKALRELEKSLEQITMGDQYDGNDLGKWPSPSVCHWVEDSVVTQDED